MVYSGHTHFTHIPAPYQCPDSPNQIQQVVLTSITAQLDFDSAITKKHYPVGFEKAGRAQYMIVNIDKAGKTSNTLHNFTVQK